MLGDDLLYFLAGGLDDEERRSTLAAVERSRAWQRDAAQRGGPRSASNDGETADGRGGGAQVPPGRTRMRLRRCDSGGPTDAERGYTPMTLTDDELRTAAERPWDG